MLFEGKNDGVLRIFTKKQETFYGKILENVDLKGCFVV